MIFKFSVQKIRVKREGVRLTFICHSFADSLNNNDKTSSVMDDFSAIGWFGEDDDLLNEIDNILLNKRQRLEKVVIACDKLKQVNTNLRVTIT